MFEVETWYGRKITVREMDDFDVGQLVVVHNNRQNSKAPQYLDGDVVKIEKKCKKNLKVSNEKYPNEYWYISPAEVKPLEVEE